MCYECAIFVLCVCNFLVFIICILYVYAPSSAKRKMCVYGKNDAKSLIGNPLCDKVFSNDVANNCVVYKQSNQLTGIQIM